MWQLSEHMWQLRMVAIYITLNSLSGSIIDVHAQDGFLKYKNNNKIYGEDFLMKEFWLMVFVEPFVVFEFYLWTSIGELMAINTSLLICSPEVKG